MLVILGRDDRELFLGGAEFAHVHATKTGIDVHEYAVRARRSGAGRHLDTLGHLGKSGAALLHFMHVPGAIKGAEHAQLVLREHLLDTDSERDVGGAGLHVVDRHVERGGGGRAGVLDVHHRHALDAKGPQRDLAAHHVLPVHMPLHAVAEEHRLDRAHFAASVLQHALQRLTGQTFQTAVEMLAKIGHADAGDVDIVHGGFPWAVSGRRGGAAANVSSYYSAPTARPESNTRFPARAATLSARAELDSSGLRGDRGMNIQPLGPLSFSGCCVTKPGESINVRP